MNRRNIIFSIAFKKNIFFFWDYRLRVFAELAEGKSMFPFQRTKGPIYLQYQPKYCLILDSTTFLSASSLVRGIITGNIEKIVK